MNNNSSTFIQKLLSNLKSIVELVIKFPGDSLTSQYGAIERIRSAIFEILTHGFKQTSKDLYEDLWQLIRCLNCNSQKYIHLLQDIYHEDNFQLTIEQWIDQSVITQCLSLQLSSFENNIDLLENYYNSHAFMRISPFYHAFIICIRSIESSDPSLLANIDPKLSIVGLNHSIPLINDVISRSHTITTPPILNKTNHNFFSDDNQLEFSSINNKQNIYHRRTHSDPIFYFNNKPNILSTEFLQNKINPEENLSNKTNSVEFESSYNSRADSNLSNEQFLPNEIPIKSINSEYQRKSIQTTYLSLFWPRKGQTLDNYLRECNSKTRTNIEKENAHFYFSETVLSAIEYIKFSEKCKKYFDIIEDDSYTLNNFEQNSNINLDDLSAETIALTIMETWKNYKIPTALELFLMIPHEDEIIEEENKEIDQNNDYTSLENNEILHRDTSQWVPLREQLIFSIHQPTTRDIQLKTQGYLCAGCGRAVEKGYAHRFRYCEYTGKYFCRSCHSDKKFYLPSYIITKWDFSNKHSVSNFAYDFLIRIYKEPIFNLHDHNPKLFEKSNKLKIINELRWALYSLRYYILACRFAEEKGYQKILLQLPSYIYEQPHIYSLQDLVKLKLRELQKIYEPIVSNLRNHVLTCSLCYAKGFICEICKNEKSIIFPFDIQTTSVCPVCQSCFHLQCHKNQKFLCPKCQRAKQRSTLSSTNQLLTPTNV